MRRPIKPRKQVASAIGDIAGTAGETARTMRTAVEALAYYAQLAKYEAKLDLEIGQDEADLDYLIQLKEVSEEAKTLGLETQLATMKQARA